MNVSIANTPSSQRAALTVLELMVAISVIGIIASLTLAGIARARANARTILCQNNCRQVVMASLAAEETGAGLPVGSDFYSRIYPFADAGNVADALASFAGNPVDDGIPSPAWAVCPDDEWGTRHLGATSYLLSNGVPNSFDYVDGEGVYRFGSNSRHLEEIADGLSNTVFVSERLQSPAFLPNRPEALFDASFVSSHSDRYHYWLSPYASANREISEFLSECLVVDSSSLDWHPIDRDPFLTRLWHQCSVGFNHVGPPNSTSCYRGDRTSGESLNPTINGSTPATSSHTGIVVVAMCDGSVRRVAEQLELAIWQAVGTIRGAERNASF